MITKVDSTQEIETFQVGGTNLLGIMKSPEFRLRLDEMWRLSEKTGREYAVGAYWYFDDKVTFTEIVKGEKRSVNSRRDLLVIDEAQENLGLFYFFVHNHPSNLSIFPSRTDITDLARIRADYERGGIQIRPIKANIKFGPYRDKSSFDILLYQEREQRPMGFDEIGRA